MNIRTILAIACFVIVVIALTSVYIVIHFVIKFW